ncbi:lectin [Paucibacter sp. KBW04]|uniref:lectin n=1 Tax=Paucibacter sp. KBW04 TaxID=2153361 RepID=UPI0018CC52C0|nr:lectin [Paucibacter sp. KBW04]
MGMKNFQQWVSGLTAVALLMPAGFAQAAEKEVELRSRGGYESLPLAAGTRDVELIEQLSGACRFNRSWGFDLSNKELWVNNGCAARFKIVSKDLGNGNETNPDEAKESSGVNPAIALAALAAIAGVAVLANRDRDDSNNNNDPVGPNYPGGRERQIRASGGLCVDIEGDAREGAGAILFRCHGGRNQRFSLGRGGELRVGGNLCLDVQGGNGDDGTRLIAWSCNGQRNQRWNFYGNQIRSQLNGKCMDVRDARFRPGQAVQLYRCNGSDAQRWSW